MSDQRVRELNDFGRDRLPGLLGLEILSCTAERVTGRIPVTPPLIAGTGFLWAPVVIALADTLCAYGTGAARPAGAESFTTVELKTNFLGTVGAGGAIAGEATPVHLGRTTQVWDAVVTDEATGFSIALFRCTQLLLYPRGRAATPPSR
jgi:1,4-dihydroxy-2-naphthoyl-CoA hydrolase